MSLYCYKGLNNKGLLRTLGSIPSKLLSQPYAGGGVKVTYVKHERTEEFLEKNLRLRRPMSPCLSIYSVQMNSALSVMHRASGIILSALAMTLGIGALVLPQDICHYVTMLEGQAIPVSLLYAVKTTIAAPFCYHFSNGIRHLIWDMGKMLNMESVFRSGYVVLVLTIVSTVCLVNL